MGWSYLETTEFSARDPNDEIYRRVQVGDGDVPGHGRTHAGKKGIIMKVSDGPGPKRWTVGLEGGLEIEVEPQHMRFL